MALGLKVDHVMMSRVYATNSEPHGHIPDKDRHPSTHTCTRTLSPIILYRNHFSENEKMAPPLVLRPGNEGGVRPTSVTTMTTTSSSSSSPPPLPPEINGLTHRYGTLRLRGAASPTETETVLRARARARPRRKARGDKRASRLKNEKDNEDDEEERKTAEGIEIPSSSSSNRRRIHWAEDVVNNEGMGKKSSKG